MAVIERTLSLFIVCRRRLSVMETDLANRTGQHNYCSDSTSGQVNNQADRQSPASLDFSPESVANNPMYVVNFSPGNLEKNINITRQNISLSKIPNSETENIYQEPSDSLKN